MALDFAAGCLGGCAGILVGHPLDTIKVHLQTQDQRRPAYRGALHCFTDIIQRESVWSLYRGMSAPLAGVAAVNAITFGVYGATRRWLGAADSLGGQFVAGALSGLAQSVICAPLEQLKTRGQLLGVGPLQCAADIMRRDGPRGLFRGLGATVLRDVPAIGVYFATYEAMTRGAAPAPTWLVLTAGGTAGAASWVLTYPVDVVKSRLQADGADGSPRKYTGMTDCLKQSLRSEGWSFLTRGLGLVVVRAFPTNAACFFTVTMILRWDQQRCQLPERPSPARLVPGSLELGLQLQPTQRRVSWHSGLVVEAISWRRSLAHISSCVFPQLEQQSTASDSSTGGLWSAPQYEAAYRLFLHTTDFTEASWLGSAEFLCPAEGDVKRQSICNEDMKQMSASETPGGLAAVKVPPSVSAESDQHTPENTSYPNSISQTPTADLPHKNCNDADVPQIIGSPASGLVRKPDAVRHINETTKSCDAGRQMDAATKVEAIEGYLLPTSVLWMAEDSRDSLDVSSLVMAENR